MSEPTITIPIELLRSLVNDEDPCWFDHHGGCQAHGYLSLEPAPALKTRRARLNCPGEGAPRIESHPSGGRKRRVKHKASTEQDRQIRDTAQRESWPVYDERANYPIAEQARQARAEGRERARA